MRSLLVAVLGSVLVAESRPAEACSCGFETPRAWPDDGAVAVPLNAKLHVTEYIRLQAISLRNLDTDEDVPLTIDERPHGSLSTDSYAIATPEQLTPLTRYRITLDAGVTTVESSFMTGDALDTTPPAFGGLESIALETMAYPITGCHSSCVEASAGHVSRIHVGYTYPEDAVMVTVELLDAARAPLGEVVFHRAHHDPKYLGFESCGVRAPTLEPGASYCARVTAYDLAGNSSGGSTEVCGQVTSCAPQEGTACTPAATCTPESQSPGGCTTSGGAGGLALVLLPIGAAVIRRRRRA